MAGSTKGLVVYNSTGYNTLCFAKMMKSYGRSFSAIQLKECLRGVFHETGISRTKEQLKSLEKNGYISRASEDEWSITENGIEQIFKSLPRDGWMPLHCVSNYPTQILNSKIGYISHLTERWGRPVGFSSHDAERWEKLVTQDHGIILVTGPTGSGKTTTLYSTLKR